MNAIDFEYALQMVVRIASMLTLSSREIFAISRAAKFLLSTHPNYFSGSLISYAGTFVYFTFNL